jgi:hypothetical protein
MIYIEKGHTSHFRYFKHGKEAEMPTKITFDRSGGVIGQQIHLQLDVDQLPEDEAQNLLHLLGAADGFEIPEDPTGRKTPDEFEYTITVEAGQSAEHTVHTSDTTMPKSLLPLVQELTLIHTLE